MKVQLIVVDNETNELLEDFSIVVEDLAFKNSAQLGREIKNYLEMVFDVEDD